MDRRGFLRGILAAAAAPAIVRIGSLMPVKSIFVPTTEEVLAFTGATSIGGGNTLLSIDLITREALRILYSNMDFLTQVNREYSDELLNVGKRGDSLIIRSPLRYG